MGIDGQLPVTQDWRELNRNPGTDDVEELREDLKRGRADSSASIIRPLSKSQRLTGR
jgi:hypothetical protein